MQKQNSILNFSLFPNQTGLPTVILSNANCGMNMQTESLQTKEMPSNNENMDVKRANDTNEQNAVQ